MLVEITTDGIPKLHCPVCNKALISLAGYVKHVKKHEPPGGFRCRNCELTFCHEEQLKEHLRIAHNAYIECRLCHSLFGSEVEHEAHIEEAHQERKFNVTQDQELFKCEVSCPL